MKMKLTVFLCLLLLNISLAQEKVGWGGYLQSRFSDDFRSSTGFSIRRAKAWIDGPTPVDTNLYFRMQAIFRYQTTGTFMLQDVYGEYRLPFGMVRAGQFVPDFSLEKQQGDAVLPLIERAAVVNSLVPAGDSYARDIGAEFVLEPKENRFHTSFGIYNGNGGNTKSNEDRRFLYTNRTTYDAGIASGISWTTGFSISYRDKKDLTFPSILGSAKTFSGRDFRWGLETHLKAQVWELQAEYIQADLENKKSYGYYAFAGYDLDLKNEIVVSTEKLDDFNPLCDPDPWYIISYSHFFSSQKEKVMIDVRAQETSSGTNYYSTLQFQFFFN